MQEKSLQFLSVNVGSINNKRELKAKEKEKERKEKERKIERNEKESQI